MQNKTIIEPRASSLNHKLRELWQYRELLLMLAYRDFRVKYAQAFLGFAWALINPLINLVSLSFVFHRVANISTGDTPPILFTLIGLAGWTYFSEVFSTAGDSIIGAQQMVKKIYFPRLIIPLSKAITALIDLGIVLALLLLLLIYYRVSPGSNLLFFPLFLILAIMAGLTGGLWLSALTIRFRDFKYISPLFLRIGIFITPIAYPASAVPEAYLFWYFLNPLAGIIEGFRWSLTGTVPLPVYAFVGFALLIILFVGSLLYFSKVEEVIADVL
ncbi:MAG: ABC transporter permease [Lewinellaceae bacterium]|nr:ABC transporter permease [Lewinellaceae bacterium]